MNRYVVYQRKRIITQHNITKMQTQTHEPKHNQLNKNNETQQSQQTTENM